MIVERVALDYLRLTTWSHPLFEMMVDDGLDIVDVPATEYEEVRWFGYVGWQHAEFFWGSKTDKNGRVHYMAQVSGWRADYWLERVARYDTELYKCTRYDIQLTLPQPLDFDPRDTTDLLRGGDWQGKKRTVNLLDGEEGSTIYLGSKKSDQFSRVYQKLDEDGKPLVRFEYVVQRKLAKETFAYVAKDRRVMVQMFKGEVQRLPMVRTEYFLALLLFCEMLKPL